jgi:hypothetical protein
MAVHGKVEDSAAIRAIRLDMESVQKAIDRLTPQLAED